MRIFFKIIRLLFLPLLLIGCVSHSPSPPSSSKQNTGFVLSNINIIDVKNSVVLSARDVFIKGEYIVDIKAHKAVKGKAFTRIDATGKYLSPGLWDMHTHIRANSHEDNLPMFIAYGVTGIRDLGLTNHQLVKDWQRAIAAGNIIGPRIISSGTIIEGAKPRFPSSLSISTVEHVKPELDKLMAQDVDIIKIFQNVPGDVFSAITDYAGQIGLQTSGHIPTGWDQYQAAESGLGSIEHLFGIGDTLSGYRDNKISEADLDKLAQALVAQNTFQSPTFVNLEYYVKLAESFNDPSKATALFETDPRFAYVPDYFMAWWDGIRARNRENLKPDDYQRYKARFAQNGKIITGLQSRGVKILAGTDVPNPYIVAGISLHDELGLYVKAGMSPADALKTATLYPAQYFGKKDESGTVSVNAHADLIILNDNPLLDIGHTRSIDGVIANGRYFTKPALDKIRAGQRARLLNTSPTDFDQFIYTAARRGGIAALREKYPDALNGEGTYTIAPHHLRRLAVAMENGYELENARLALEWNLALFPNDAATVAALEMLSSKEP